MLCRIYLPTKNIALTLSLAIITLLLFTSCKTKETIARLPRPEKPLLKMQINNVEWQGNKVVYRVANSSASGNPESRINTWGGIYAMQNDTPSYYLEELGFLLMKKKAGRQIIKYVEFNQLMSDLINFSDITPVYISMGTSHQMGEMICEDFEVDDTKDNWVEIIQEEDNYKYIWGQFNLHLIRTKSCATAKYTDTLRLNNGEFYIEQP